MEKPKQPEKRSKNTNYLEFMLEYIQKQPLFRSKSIAIAYLKEHPEMNGYKRNEKENIIYITRVIAGYIANIKGSCKKSINYRRRVYKTTSEFIRKIKDFLNGEVLKHKQKEYYNNQEYIMSRFYEVKRESEY